MECPPLWTEAGQSIHRMMFVFRTQMTKVLPQLGEVYAQGLEPAVRHLFAEGRRHRAETDLLAARIAESGCIPETISPEIAYQLFLRAECACDFVGQLFPLEAKDGPGADPAGWDLPKLRRWLLIDSWYRRGDLWMKLTAMEWTGPFPFYGIEAAPEFGG